MTDASFFALCQLSYELEYGRKVSMFLHKMNDVYKLAEMLGKTELPEPALNVAIRALEEYDRGHRAQIDAAAKEFVKTYMANDMEAAK